MSSHRFWSTPLMVGTLIAASGLTGSALANDPVAQVDALEALAGKHPGFRRGQAKGVCASGHFIGTEAGRGLSKASAFSGDKHAVVARFSVGGGNPTTTDQSKSARGLALQMTLPNGEQWQMANISAPLYFVGKPELFAPFVLARAPDPATGKPDPDALAAFSKAHPETLKQAAWLAEQPIGGSYAGYRYWGVNAFELTDAEGESQFVRWSFTPQVDLAPPDAATLAKLGDDFLADDLARRLEDGPVAFDFHLQLATDDDSRVDATTIWPDSNPRVLAGTLVIDATTPGVGGACDKMMFNPLTLPAGIAPSDDPVLHARPGAYAVSFGRRAGGQ